ncbi:hypothetical protein GIB67_019378 [Kingdonia uniflora]|uniref:Uncharacterized protein n=1 Tax=Kingdonia uniflora TaxID=39325 RepID=A0A7J7M1T8_9MAGN|nr:hypothetical protein GIB67_019378 [Kingdonia uniflora]
MDSGKLFSDGLPEGECTLTLEVALQCKEIIANRNNNLEQRLADMQAHQKELLREAVQGELADYMVDQTKGLGLEKEGNEQVLRDQLTREGMVSADLQCHVKELVENVASIENEFRMSTDWWVVIITPPLLTLLLTQDVPELRHLDYSGRQGPLPTGIKKDITAKEEAEVAAKYDVDDRALPRSYIIHEEFLKPVVAML